MSLSDRLDSVRRAQQPIAPVQNNGQLRVLPAIVDPFAEVKARVHQAMIDQLGPKLYDPNLPAADLESRVRCRPARIREFGRSSWQETLVGPAQTDCFRVARRGTRPGCRDAEVAR